MNDMMLEGAALRRRYQELAKEFEERHPAKSAANKFVNGLFEASRVPLAATVSSRADRDRERAAAELFVRYDILSDLFKSASIELEEFVFDLLLKIIRASNELGIHAAPDGRAARLARHDRASSKFVKLVSTVMIYLEAHPELEPKASEKFANIIRPDILELFGKPKKAPSKIPPSLSAIVKALRSVRKRSFVL
jgi:hypothetical protein